MIVVLGSVGMGMRAWMSRYKEKRAEIGRAQRASQESCGKKLRRIPGAVTAEQNFER